MISILLIIIITEVAHSHYEHFPLTTQPSKKLQKGQSFIRPSLLIMIMSNPEKFWNVNILQKKKGLWDTKKALTVTSDGVRHVNIVDLQLSYVEPVFFTSVPGVRKFLATPVFRCEVVVDFFHALELGVPLMKLLHRHLNLQIIAASLTLQTVHYVASLR